MSKTPISSLQEIMARGSLGLPIYDLVAETNGTHLASFTYRVKCNSSTGPQTALGTASNKKDAKHNAAREMLKILDSCGANYSQLVDSPNVVPCKPKIPAINSYYDPGSKAVSPSEIFVNSVGKLSEFCITHRLIAPQYEVRNSSGPAHMMKFTMICTVGKFSTQATAMTKKQAKHDAAQEMLKNLMKSSPSKGFLNNTSNIESIEREMQQDLPVINMLELQIEAPKMPILQSAELAKELFPKLRLRDSVKVVKDIHVKDYHNALKELMDPNIRNNVQRELKTITTESRMKEELNRIAKLMGTTVKTTILVNSINGCAVSCTLDSIPTMADIGVGNSILEAEKKALSNLLSTIDVMLK